MQIDKDTITLTHAELIKEKNNSFEDGANHNKHASQETRALINNMTDEVNKLTTCMEVLKTDVKYIKEALDKNDKDHTEIMKTIKEFIETADKRYSPMTCWSVMKYAGAVVGTILITAFMYLVIEKKI
jgi:seryl-tRNA synthetase